MYDKRNSRGAKFDREFALGNRRNTSRRVIRDQSVHLVSDHMRAVRTTKRLRGQPEIGLRFRPLPTKICVLVQPFRMPMQILTKKDQTMDGWRTQSHDQDSSNPTSIPESSRTSLAPQTTETRPQCSFVSDETLILIEILVCAVWYKEWSSTHLAVSFQEDPLSTCLFTPSW